MVDNITEQNISKRPCKLNSKCILTVVVIFVLFVASVVLFTQYRSQSQIIQQQNDYIAQLKQKNVTLVYKNGIVSTARNIATLFDDSWVSFKYPFENIADNLLNSFGRRFNHSLSRTNYNYIDYSSTKDKYEINIALPGFTKDKISIELVNDDLIIYAKTGSSNEAKNKIENSNKGLGNDNTHTRQTRWNNEVRQSIRIPRDINQEQITTSLNNGILTIIIPRNYDVKLAKKIEIN